MHLLNSNTYNSNLNIHNYFTAKEFLYSQLPMFHRIGAVAYKANLDNTYALMDAIGNPQNTFPTIHVAGTNGKGSSSHLIASILYENGLKTGLHTSPHLKDLTERIMFNGKKVSKLFVINFLKRYSDDIIRIKPSFFELMVAMAFKYFSNRVDVAVIEVGMGGRLDSTNIIIPEVSLITNISYDHTQFLGDTLPKIAAEKAGIIKESVPICISQTQDEVKEVFIHKAEQMHAPIYFADEHFSTQNSRVEDDYLVMDVYHEGEIYLKDLRIGLLGDYQQKNILGVLQVIDVLNKSKRWHISSADIRNGLMNVQQNFTLMGRWQKLKDRPLTICDTGHNEDGLKYVLNQLKRVRGKNKLNFVFGVVNDKDIDTEIDMLPKDAYYFLCKADIPRGLDVEVLSKKFSNKGLVHHDFNSVKQAYDTAVKEARQSGAMVFIGGSTYTVAEIV